MALSAKEKADLLTRSLPARRETVRLLQDYLSRTGLTQVDFARRINYSTISVRMLICDRYNTIAGDDSAIRAAIHDFISAHPIEAVTDSEGKLYETENVQCARKYFYEALDGRRAYYFRGAPGTQKSFVLQHLIAELNRSEIAKNGHGRRAFYVYCSDLIRPNQLMRAVAEAAGSISAGDNRRIFKNLRFDLGKRKVLFVFDEAQHLDVHCLETLRELLDMPPHCGLLFAGSHELEKTFQRLDMEQWHSRLRQGAELPGISETEAFGIISAELGAQSDTKIQALIKKCYATDLRKGRTVKYISARTLFWSIQSIQDRQKSKAGANA
ncbi:MAG: AAA family ATPase [Terriglobales bacterium]